MKVAMVTGPSSGIGKVVAIELGKLGFHVVGAGRSVERTQLVIKEIQGNGGSAEYLALDLASLGSARNAARTLEANHRQLDLLVNNAGVGAVKGLTTDGFEIHFGVNHLGHFMLTHHLRNILRPGARIVQVSSEVHHRATVLDMTKLRRRTSSLYGLKEYAVSKLANVLFARELARRRPEWHSFAVHPGLTDTNIIPRYVRPLIRRRLKTPEQGADTVIWCATSDDVKGQSGHYFARRRATTPSPLALDDVLAFQLWRQSEQWCGVD